MILPGSRDTLAGILTATLGPSCVVSKVRKDKKNEVVRSRRAVRWTLRWFSTT